MPMQEPSDAPQTPGDGSDDAGWVSLADLAAELAIGLDDLDAGRLYDGDAAIDGLLETPPEAGRA